MNGAQLLAFGNVAVLEDATGGSAERVSIDPLAESAPTPERALIYEAITRAFARTLPCWPMVRDRGHRLIVRSKPDLTRHHAAVQALQTAYGEALTGLDPTDVGVDQRLWHLWLVFGPHTWLTAQAKTADTKPVGTRRRHGVGAVVDRRNERWASIIDCWAALLAPQAETVIDMHLNGPEGSESYFVSAHDWRMGVTIDSARGGYASPWAASPTAAARVGPCGAGRARAGSGWVEKLVPGRGGALRQQTMCSRRRTPHSLQP